MGDREGDRKKVFNEKENKDRQLRQILFSDVDTDQVMSPLLVRI